MIGLRSQFEVGVKDILGDLAAPTLALKLAPPLSEALLDVTNGAEA